MTHDYKRNGTTTLFAALNVVEGTVIGTACRGIAIRSSSSSSSRSTPRRRPDLDLHLIVDNYATHKHPKCEAGCKHQRFHLHFIPTSSSWLNLVERWFREITDKRIRRGAFKSVEQLIE